MKRSILFSAAVVAGIFIATRAEAQITYSQKPFEATVLTQEQFSKDRRTPKTATPDAPIDDRQGVAHHYPGVSSPPDNKKLTIDYKTKPFQPSVVKEKNEAIDNK